MCKKINHELLRKVLRRHITSHVLTGKIFTLILQKEDLLIRMGKMRIETRVVNYDTFCSCISKKRIRFQCC